LTPPPCRFGERKKSLAGFDAAKRDIKNERAREISSTVVEITNNVPEADFRVAVAEGATIQLSNNPRGANISCDACIAIHISHAFAGLSPSCSSMEMIGNPDGSTSMFQW
jgi:hypothetical protein